MSSSILIVVRLLYTAAILLMLGFVVGAVKAGIDKADRPYDAYHRYHEAAPFKGPYLRFHPGDHIFRGDNTTTTWFGPNGGIFVPYEIGSTITIDQPKGPTKVIYIGDPQIKISELPAPTPLPPAQEMFR